MSNAANIVWEEDDEDQIIEYVRTHPCFYDTSSADYKNREIRSAEWDNLAKKFDVPVAAMQRKWKALNDAFNRCEKTKRSKKSGDGAVVQPKWVHYEKMKFLLPYRSSRETQTTIQRQLSGVENEAPEKEAAYPEEDKDPEPEGKEMPPARTPVSAVKKRKVEKVQSSPGVDDLFKKTLSEISAQMNKEPSDVQLFTDHIASQLSKLSVRRQLRAKDAIQQVVSKALDEQYAEEEEAERMRSSPQILPPTQPSQYYPHYAHGSLHTSAHSSAHTSGPPSTSSSYSYEGTLSSTAALLSEVGSALYTNGNGQYHG